MELAPLPQWRPFEEISLGRPISARMILEEPRAQGVGIMSCRFRKRHFCCAKAFIMCVSRPRFCSCNPPCTLSWIWSASGGEGAIDVALACGASRQPRDSISKPTWMALLLVRPEAGPKLQIPSMYNTKSNPAYQLTNKVLSQAS